MCDLIVRPKTNVFSLCGIRGALYKRRPLAVTRRTSVDRETTPREGTTALQSRNGPSHVTPIGNAAADFEGWRSSPLVIRSVSPLALTALRL